MENLGEFIVNHWLLWTIFFVLLGMIVATTISNQLSGAATLSTAQAITLVNQKKGVFVDVRAASEFEKAHIADSVNLPASSLQEGMSAIKDKQKPVIIISANGQGTLPIAKKLQENGFSEVYILKGGIHTWKEAKLPLFS